MLVRSLIVAVMLGVVGFAQADQEKSDVNQQQLSRRPYAVVPSTKPDVVEGNVDTAKAEEGEKKYKTLQLHSLGRRPYSEK